MSKISEMPVKIQLLGAAAAVLGLTLAGYFLHYKPMQDANHVAQQQLDAKVSENVNLRQYEPKLQEMKRQIVMLQNQLDIQKRIVPDEKEADQFMRLVQDTAGQAGVEIRRYTAKSAATREFFTEAPFEVELDGSYYGMLNFFDRVGKLERIINVGGLKVASLKKGSESGAKKKYDYAPGESVVATCVATTFFSHEGSLTNVPATSAAQGAKPATAAAPTTTAALNK